MKDWIYLFFSTTFFSGFLLGKLGAGTVGSIVAFIIQVILLNNKASLLSIFMLIIISIAIGMIVVSPSEYFIYKKWGLRKKHDGRIVSEDFNEITIDEVVGQFIAGFPVFLLPDDGLSTGMRIALLVLSLILFRIYDVLKPGIIKWPEENMTSPFSVIFDDIFAGVAAAATSVALWIPIDIALTYYR